MVYDNKIIDEPEERNYQAIDSYKCKRCKRNYKCRNSNSSSGCPVCDTSRA